MTTVRSLTAVVLAIGICVLGVACGGPADDDDQPGNDLDHMRTARVTIESTTFETWIADSIPTWDQGLMFVEAEQMAPLADGAQRGMLFVFPFEIELSFWMKDTYIPLDIAYTRSDGTIVKIYTMTPLDTDPGKYPSEQPARYALEVTGGLFAELGISEGDVIDIPSEVLDPS